MKNLLKSKWLLFIGFVGLVSCTNQVQINDSFDPNIPSSEKLEFILSKAGDSYAVKCKDTSIRGAVVIPSEYNGLPVTRINDGGFKGCESLTSVYIPDSIEQFFVISAFLECPSLASLEVSTNNPSYFSVDGVLYDKQRNSLCCCPRAKTGHLNICDGITSIEGGSFLEQSSLDSIYIPTSLTSIEKKVFTPCTSLVSIDVAEGNASFESKDGVLYEKKKDVLFRCPPGKKGRYVIPDGTVSISDSSFEWCASITSIRVPASVSSVAKRSFANCSSLLTVEFDDSLKATTLGGQCFADCKSLNSITLPNSITSIGDSSFQGCSSLKTIKLSDNLTSINSFAFDGCSLLTSIRLPDSLVSIGYSAFINCSSLISITIPYLVKAIEKYAFCSCSSLASIEVSANNENYLSHQGVLYSRDMKTILSYPGGMRKDHFDVPNGVISIEEGSFVECLLLRSITFPNSVMSIGTRSFSGCSAIVSISFLGSVDQWKTVTKGKMWNYGVPASKVSCVDGTIEV